jgi:hypothetical protein
MKTQKIIGVLILIFVIAFLIPYLGQLISLILNPTFSGNENKPYAWLSEGQKLKFVSSDQEVIQLVIKKIDYDWGVEFTSGFYRTKSIIATINNKEFSFMGASKTFNTGTAPYEEAANYCPTFSFSIPNDITVKIDYENEKSRNYNYGDYYLQNPKFDQSLKIGKKIYNNIAISIHEVYLNKNNVSSQNIDYTNDIKNKKIEILFNKKIPNIETDERPYFLKKNRLVESNTWFVAI